MKENKLIAEFMGVNVITLDDVRKNKNPYFSSADGYLEDDLKYHTSWDKLMPVVERCYHNGAEENEVGDITHALLDCNRDHLYISVVKFIKTYNDETEV